MSPRNPGELSIKSIKSSKKGIEVAFSDDSALWLSPDSYTDFHLFLGKKVGEDEYRRLKEFADSDALYKQALGWLSTKLLSKKEVYDRLTKESDDEKAIQTAVDRLQSQGLIDDRRLVEEYLEYRAYPAFYKYDFDYRYFKWIDADNNQQSIYSFIRMDDEYCFVIVLNMMPIAYEDYMLGVPYWI